jgi:uncharacterized membrane protein (UPF0136 family)
MTGRGWPRLAVIVTASIGMLWWTWGAWPDPFIDFGRELYVAWRLVQGDALYVDVESFNGPLSPYVNAGWFRIFGISLRSLVLGNLVIVGVLLWLLYRTFETLSSSFAATVACLTFIGLFAFGQIADLGNYNFVTPYSHEITHGALLSFLAIHALRLHLRSGSLASAIAVGLALGLTFLTKVEIFAAAGPAVLIGLTLATALRPRPERRGWLVAAAVTSGMLTIVGVAFLCLRTAMPANRALVGLMGSWRYALDPELSSHVFYQRIAGLDHPWESLRVVFNATLGYGLVFGSVTLVAMVLRRPRFGLELAGAVGFVAVILLAAFSANLSFEQMARPLPVFTAVLTGLLAWALARNWAHQARARALVLPLTVALFSLLLLAKIALNVKVHRYGFVLAMPATLVLVVALLDWIPKRIEAAGGAGTVFRSTALVAWSIAVAVHLAVNRDRLDVHRYIVAEGTDRFRSDSRGILMNAALAEIRSRLTPNESLVVVPEGVMLNYLARRSSSSPFVTFLPPEIIMFGQDRILNSLQSHPPDYVAVVDRPTDEYGVPVFGRDYGEPILTWIAAGYRPVASIESTPLQEGRFGIRLFRRMTIPR